MRSQRYSGRWSQNLLTMRWASSPGPAKPRLMGAAGRAAVVNVDTAGRVAAPAVAIAAASSGGGIMKGVARSFSSSGGAGAAIDGGVDAADLDACLRFSQQGQ